MNKNKVKVTLAKELRKKLGIRQFPIIRGDVVKVIKGTRRTEGGKVSEVDHKHSLIVVEGINIAKADGKEKEFYVKPEKLEITKLDLTMDERVVRIRELAALKHIEVNQEELEEFSAKTEEPTPENESEPTEIEPVEDDNDEEVADMQQDLLEETEEESDASEDENSEESEDEGAEESQDEEEMNKDDKQD